MRMHLGLNSLNYLCKAMPPSWFCLVKTASCNPSVQTNFNEQLFACFIVYNGGGQQHAPYLLLLHTHTHTQYWQHLMMHLK